MSVIEHFLSSIPTSGWIMIGLVVIWAVSRLFKRRSASARGVLSVPGDVRDAGREEHWNRLSEALRPRLVGSREQVGASPSVRLLASAMPDALMDSDPVDDLRVSDAGVTAEKLQTVWGVAKRDELITFVYSLLRDGHRKPLMFLREQCENQSWAAKEIALLDKTADSSVPKWERRWRIQRILADERGVRSLDFAAWDLLHAASLTRAGGALGWLSPEETWDTLAFIGRALQASYSSWEETWRAFHVTRWLSDADNDTASKDSDLRDRVVGEFLLGEGGLWTVIPWDAPYPAPRFLLLDALASTGSLRPLSSGNWEDANEWERTLDSHARSRAPLSAGGKPTVN